MSTDAALIAALLLAILHLVHLFNAWNKEIIKLIGKYLVLTSMPFPDQCMVNEYVHYLFIILQTIHIQRKSVSWVSIGTGVYLKK